MAPSIAIIGAPSSLGGLPLGSNEGPARLREAGLVERLRAAGREVSDLGDVPIRGRRARVVDASIDFTSVEAVARHVARYACRALEDGMLPLVIGGDHSVAIGNIAAASRAVPALGLVWIDAHPDFNTPETTVTGNLHGMVLAIAAGRGPAPLVRLLGHAPVLRPDRIAVIGARAIDAGEVNSLREAGVRVYDGEYLHRHGVRKTVAEAMAYLARNEMRAVHLSIDLDVLDPARWPGVSTPAPGGVTSDELALAARTVAEMAPIVAMDVVELTPPQDVDGATAEAAILAVESALGRPAAPCLFE